MSRLAKQIVYGTVFILLLALIASWIYFAFFRSAPSCTNGRQDALEEGLDCGPACGNICVPDSIQAIQVPEEVKIFHPQPGRLGLLGKIQDPNPDFAVSELAYRFDFYNESGEKLGSQSGRTFLYAGEIRELTAFLERPDAGEAVRAELSIAGVKWAKGDEFKRPDVLLQDHAVNADGREIRATGKLVNRDSLRTPEVTVTAVFVDDAGTPLGVSETRLANVESGETRTFTILHPEISGLNPGRTQFFVTAARP